MLQWSRVTLGFLVLGGFLGAADIGQAQGVTVPNTFVNGEVADADDVNANFTAITVRSPLCSSKLTALRSYRPAEMERSGHGISRPVACNRFFRRVEEHPWPMCRSPATAC